MNFINEFEYQRIDESVVRLLNAENRQVSNVLASSIGSIAILRYTPHAPSPVKNLFRTS